MVQSATTHGGFQLRRARQTQASVQAAVQCLLCPEVTPERGIEILATTTPTDLSRAQKVTNVTRERTEALVTDKAWRTAALAWISAYWTEHGHGPTWRQFLTADALWPPQLPEYVRRVAMAKLYQRGYLDGTKTPFGLKACDKPVSRIPKHRTAPKPAPAKAA